MLGMINKKNKKTFTIENLYSNFYQIKSNLKKKE
jgi:hypothetical protein